MGSLFSAFSTDALWQLLPVFAASAAPVITEAVKGGFAALNAKVPSKIKPVVNIVVGAVLGGICGDAATGAAVGAATSAGFAVGKKS